METKTNTFDLPAHLHRAIRIHAASTEENVGVIIAHAVSQYLDRVAPEVVSRELAKDQAKQTA